MLLRARRFATILVEARVMIATLAGASHAPVKFGAVALGKTKTIKTTITLVAGFRPDGGAREGVVLELRKRA
jgi:hypothetical protein